MRNNRWSRVVLAVLAASGMACSGGAQKSEAGDLSISVAAISGGPQIVYVRIYGDPDVQPGVTPPYQQIASATSVDATGKFNVSLTAIPVGTYKLHAKGFDAFDAVYDDAAVWESGTPDPTITIVAAQTATGNLMMQQVDVPVISNKAPYVDFLSASSATAWSAAYGGLATSVTLNARAKDGDANLSGYAWFDDVGGAFDAAGTGNISGGIASIGPVAWTPPANFTGTAVLSLEVYDVTLNASRVALTISVTATPGFGSAIVAVGYNSAPIDVDPLLANFIFDPITGAVSGGGQIAAGADTLLTVSGYDPNGDVLTFAFADDCGGSFGAVNQVGTGTNVGTDLAMADVVFTAPATAPSSGICTVTATLDDANGGQQFVNLELTIGLPTPVYP
jgi:hypothetical protein